MIQKVISLANTIHNLSYHKEINNTLPVLLHILEKKDKNTYLAKIGNLITQTKSQKNLLIGEKYFATLQKNSLGTLVLSNLTPYPKAFELFQNSPLKFNLDELKDLFKSHEHGTEEWKDFLIDKFVNAPNKNDFLFFGNMLLSLQKNIISLCVQKDNKNQVLQIKKNYKEKLEFYALYPNFGSISGLVYQLENSVGLKLEVLSENIKNFLEKHLIELDFFAIKEININSNIEPLYNFSDNLLDLKG